MPRRKAVNPIAAFALRTLGRVASKAVDHATASIAEDIREFTSEIDRRAKRVIERAQCHCDCAACYIALQHPLPGDDARHCGVGRCGVHAE